MRKLYKRVRTLIPRKILKGLKDKYYLKITIGAYLEKDDSLVYSKSLDLFNND